MSESPNCCINKNLGTYQNYGTVLVIRGAVSKAELKKLKIFGEEKMKKAIATMTLALMLTLGATFAKADNGTSDSTGGIIIAGFTQVGIIIAGYASPGIIIAN